MNDVDQVIDRLKRRYGVETDTDLAAAPSISRSSVANWRNRNSVPDRYMKIADGEASWAVRDTPSTRMPDIERAIMRIAIMRIIRDFRVVADDYRGFMEQSMAAAAAWQPYWETAFKDLMKEMDLRVSEDAHHCADLLVFNEMSSTK